MTWVSTKQRLPPKKGWYNVIKLDRSCLDSKFIKTIPPSRTLEYMEWKPCMKLEEDCEDRVVYKKYKAFFETLGMEHNSDEIIYWYELDPLPEEGVFNGN